MGCDIHSFAEKRNSETGKWEIVKNAFTLDEFDRKRMGVEKGDEPFNWRSYSIFAFLADVRNYDHCEPIAKPKGVPQDICDEIKEKWKYWEDGGHSASFLTAKELLEFDYEKTFWNRRISKQIAPNCWSGAELAEEGEGEIVSYKDNLGEFFFVHLDDLKAIGNPEDVRIVFWFDN